MLHFIFSFFLLGFTGNYNAQGSDVFVFQSFDYLLVNFWLSSEGESHLLDTNVDQIENEWIGIRGLIANTSIEHFDQYRFIKDQDDRIMGVKNSVKKNKLIDARKETYILLQAFSEVRSCYTNSDYYLDAILDAYDTYISVHRIIHDEMLALYEWTEFIHYVDQLQCKVEILKAVLKPIDGSSKSQLIDESLTRLYDCLVTLNDSLEHAYRPDFEVPCDELESAFKELFLSYMSSLEM